VPLKSEQVSRNLLFKQQKLMMNKTDQTNTHESNDQTASIKAVHSDVRIILKVITDQQAILIKKRAR
jgi:hypothetical protein